MLLALLVAVAALLVASIAVVFGPLAVLLWTERKCSSSTLMMAGMSVAAVTAGALVACWRWRPAKRGRWCLLGVPFVLGQAVLLRLWWQGSLPIPLWLAGLPAVSVLVLAAVVFGCTAWFSLLWGDGKGFGT